MGAGNREPGVSLIYIKIIILPANPPVAYFLTIRWGVLGTFAEPSSVAREPF